MKQKSATLTGAALDKAVTLIEQPQYPIQARTGWLPYSTSWALCGPLIDEHGINLMGKADNAATLDEHAWFARYAYYTGATGRTLMVAICRCIVVKIHGEEVDI